MAVDTERKRWSMLQWASGPSYYPTLFNPDTSGIDATERATVLKLYGGIAWDSPVEVEPEPEPEIEQPGAGGGGEPERRRRTVENRISDGLFDGFEPFKEPEQPEEARAADPDITPVIERPITETLRAKDDLTQARIARDAKKRREQLAQERAESARKAQSEADALTLLAFFETEERARLEDEEDVLMLLEAVMIRRRSALALILQRAN
jgi:hypothetical protein